MLKTLALISCLLGSSSLFSNPVEIPQIINFSRYQNNREDIDPRNLIYCAPFNDAPEIGIFFLYLKENFPIDAAIETGIYEGNTTIYFSYLFDEVHTIDNSESLYKKSAKFFQRCPNVLCHFGSSQNVLNELLPSLSGKGVLFYLDAHGNGANPLLGEIEAISRTHKDNCIIVIDDFQVPGRRDIGHDTHCTYDNIKAQLDKVFTEYTVHYLIPKNLNCSSKFVAIPKKWQNN